ncbi:hypothetical protein D9619_013289 [Psilocybe cf. subviscida]|uniref:F-box domain-containing protein n=1 Tax=Psilocybe cf. subviscida TaxID=2480587 RepID=A0A8H5F964_9AGAR|nr:hypothetical protein D9619_013289 [Psilocybe cf. subviscida]
MDHPNALSHTAQTSSWPMSPPTVKRKLPEDSHSGYRTCKSRKKFAPYQKHEKYWYPDGDILLQIADTRFKVRRNRLESESIWFRDLIDYYNGTQKGRSYKPQEDIQLIADAAHRVDGIPLFYLDIVNPATQFSTPEIDEVSHLLSATYQETTDYACSLPKMTEIVSLYRTARRYKFKRYEAFCEKYLENMFPDISRRISEAASVRDATLGLLVGQEFGLGHIKARALHDLARARVSSTRIEMRDITINLLRSFRKDFFAIEDEILTNFAHAMALQRHLKQAWVDITEEIIGEVRCKPTRRRVYESCESLDTATTKLFIDTIQSKYPNDPLTAIQEVVTQTKSGNRSQQVLALPELLAAIFSFVDRKTNFRNALVCRTWSDVALGEIWRNLDNLHAFFNILAPLRLETHASQLFKLHLFSRVPTDADWQRVSRYSTLVRTFEYRDVPGRYPLSRQIFTDIAQTRPNVIFPHLHTLVWNPPKVLAMVASMGPSVTLLFLHPGVTSISITLPDKLTPEPHGPTLLEIATRAPNLSDLILITNSSPGSIETDLCAAVSKLSRLKQITLPQRFSTSRIFNTCSKLPALHAFKFGFGLPTTFFRERGRPFLPDTLPDAFPALETFSLLADFPDILAALNALPTPQNLKYLEFGSRNVAAEDIGRLIDLVSSSSKWLRGFSFTSKSPFRERDISDVPPPIDLHMLKSLTVLPQLGMLSLDHPTPLALSLDDIDSLLSALPNLTVLTLNVAPIYYEESLLGFDVLGVAGNRCRRLIELGVFINATLPVTSLPLEAAPEKVIFTGLRVLLVGLSVITKETIYPTALLLSKVLPVTCTLNYGTPSKLSSGIDARFDLWGEVDSLLRLFQKARQDKKDGTLGVIQAHLGQT